MEFRETLLAAQRNQQEKASVGSSYYKARFDPPKKEQKSRDRLSANIQKFLAKKEEEEKQKKLEAQRKKEELIAMRDPKALRKIQKTLKVIKSANKSVLADAIDTEHTAVTREGPDQPDQDDYGYESQEAAALYEKMMQKYSKIPDEPKFPSSKTPINKDLNGTRERVKNALQHEDDPVPHKRRRRTDNSDKDGGGSSPPQKYEPEKKKDEKPEKPKFRKPAPPPMDFNQLLKLAEQKKSEPLEVVAKKVVSEPEPERPMTKKQRREYEEEMARRQRRQERMEAEKSGRKVVKEERTLEKEKPYKRPEERPSGFGRIPKLGAKNAGNERSEAPKSLERDRHNIEREKAERIQREKDRVRSEKEKADSEKLRLERERFEKLKAERDRIDREMEKFREREKLDKSKLKLDKSSDRNKPEKTLDKSKMGAREHELKKSIDLKIQNTYRIDKNSNEKRLSVPQKDQRLPNGQIQGKPIPKTGRDVAHRSDKDKLVSAKQKGPVSEGPKDNGIRMDKKVPDSKRPDDRRPMPSKPAAGSSKAPISNSFDFDKHVNSLGKNGSKLPPAGTVKRKPHPDEIRKKQKRRTLDSESEYDSEMDDFIDDGDENMDYSTHIKEIFGYDRSKYRDLDDDDDPTMESSFARQQREEYISKKIGIMEDLEDMRMEAMEKSKKKKRRISDD